MKDRLDRILVQRGIAQSREAAQALIEEGNVSVHGMVVIKSSSMVDVNVPIVSTGTTKYVSRGGIKLEAALDFFLISPEGKSVVDVGASTGGFTDCMLQRGAQRVYCVDVGYGQLAWKIRQDSRVVVLDRINARYIDPCILDHPADIAVIDVSFISLQMILPSVIRLIKPRGEILALVKPQFEVGRGDVGKGGIVRDAEKRMKALTSITEFMEKIGLCVKGSMQSPITGQKGNIEYFIYALR